MFLRLISQQGTLKGRQGWEAGWARGDTDAEDPIGAQKEKAGPARMWGVGVGQEERWWGRGEVRRTLVGEKWLNFNKQKKKKPTGNWIFIS